MVHREFKSLISELFYAAQEIPKLSQVIVYGSVAREEEHRESDVDLLLIFDCSEDPEKTYLADIAQKKIGSAFINANCQRNAQIFITNLKDLDESFMENIIRDGIIIYGKPLFMEAKKLLKTLIMFEYKVGGNSATKKVRFYRALKNLNLKKVKNAIIIQNKQANNLKEVFELNHINYKKTKIWMV